MYLFSRIILLSIFPLYNFPLFLSVIKIAYCTNINVQILITLFNNNKKKSSYIILYVLTYILFITIHK